MIVPLLLFAAAAADWSGTWVYRVEGHNLYVLTLHATGGMFARPKVDHLNPQGEVSDVSPEIEKQPVSWVSRGHKLRAGEQLYLLTVVDRDHIELAETDTLWWKISFTRARPSDDLTIPSPWPELSYPPEIVELQKRLAAMVKADQEARAEKPFSVERIDRVDIANRPEVERIFDHYGWPKWSLVGKLAAHNYWLLVQHQDKAPELQRRSLIALERAVADGEASRSDYAYLYDRVAGKDGKPQRWGTQVRCVNGRAVLGPVDDPAGLDARRRELNMIPIKENLKRLRPMCAPQR